jgi:hypothetical protein
MKWTVYPSAAVSSDSGSRPDAAVNESAFVSFGKAECRVDS